MKTAFLMDHLGSMERRWYVSADDKCVCVCAADAGGQVDPLENICSLSKTAVKTNTSQCMDLSWVLCRFGGMACIIQTSGFFTLLSVICNAYGCLSHLRMPLLEIVPKCLPHLLKNIPKFYCVAYELQICLQVGRGQTSILQAKPKEESFPLEFAVSEES